jgi:hypothetical protein
MTLRKLGLALAAMATLFTASAANAAGNLIVNGDFSAGNTGFTSDYTYVAPTANAMYPEGLYTIWNNPVDVHNLWVDDAAAPTMLIENGYTGSDTANHAVWRQDGLAGVAGETYLFSASIMNVCCNASFGGNLNAPSEILFQVSGNGADWTTILDYITSPGAVAPEPDDGILVNVNASFVNGFGGAFDIRAIDGLNAASGNDFGITNLSLSAVPEPATWAMMLLGFATIGFGLRNARKQGAVALA